MGAALSSLFVLWAATAALPAAAIPFSEEQLDLYGDFNGDTLEYDFINLPAIVGTNGTLRIRTGESQASDFDGLDLDDDTEYFTLFIDGFDLGNYNCGGLPNNDLGCTVVSADSQFDTTYDFALDFSADLGGLTLADLIADNELEVRLAFTDDVSFSDELDEVFVELAYEIAAGQVPVPATLALMVLGLAGMASRRRLSH